MPVPWKGWHMAQYPWLSSKEDLGSTVLCPVFPQGEQSSQGGSHPCQGGILLLLHLTKVCYCKD